MNAMPRTIRVLLGGPSPRTHFGIGAELGGQVWYPLKVLHINHHLFAVTETISLSVYEPIAICVLWRDRAPPSGGRDGVRGSGVIPRESPPY